MLSRGRARKPARFLFWPSQSAIQTHRALCNHEWNPGGDPLVKSFVERRAFLRKHTAADLDAGLLQNLDPAPAMARVRIGRADHDRLYAGPNDFIRACAGAP